MWEYWWKNLGKYAHLFCLGFRGRAPDDSKFLILDSINNWKSRFFWKHSLILFFLFKTLTLIEFKLFSMGEWKTLVSIKKFQDVMYKYLGVRAKNPMELEIRNCHLKISMVNWPFTYRAIQNIHKIHMFREGLDSVRLETLLLILELVLLHDTIM